MPWLVFIAAEAASWLARQRALGTQSVPCPVPPDLEDDRGLYGDEPFVAENLVLLELAFARLECRIVDLLARAIRASGVWRLRSLFSTLACGYQELRNVSTSGQISVYPSA